VRKLVQLPWANFSQIIFLPVSDPISQLPVVTKGIVIKIGSSSSRSIVPTIWMTA
jgi:hypothetical protein